MSGEEIGGLITFGMLLIIGIVFGIQFYRLDKVTRETDKLWDELMEKLEDCKDEAKIIKVVKKLT